MRKEYFDLLYLASCGVNRQKPSMSCIEFYKEHPEALAVLYKLSKIHSIEGLIGITLQKAELVLNQDWNVSIAKAIRKVLLFDAERSKILSYMEQNRIWYLTLKGVILKNYYPSVGMRQMSDNDILYDGTQSEKLRAYMVEQGYTVLHEDYGFVDVYEKEPVYNFEMHRALYGESDKNTWEKYYRNIKDRLILNENSTYGYHMTDEDFYIYIVCHAYKHYAASGTGIRSLLDFYVYLKVKERTLDFDYIQKECEKLEISDFEKCSRELCKKVFALETLDAGQVVFEKQFSQEEMDMLLYYLTSGTYGTFEQRIQNSLNQYKNKDGKVSFLSKIRYSKDRIFPGVEVYSNYPFFNKHRWLVPVFWVRRIILMIFSRERRTAILEEMKRVRGE